MTTKTAIGGWTCGLVSFDGRDARTYIEHWESGMNRSARTNGNALSIRSFVSVWLFTLAAAPLAAQLEPCGFFEVDGQPGYGAPDLRFTAAFWLQTGAFPAVPDFNQDGRVNVLDLVSQSNCVDNLTHGLIGKYYGFADGTEGQSISFPDFNSLPGNPDPVLVRPTERFEVLDGNRGFMDSDMRRNFGAVYEGYLFVPETSQYTFNLFARRGARVYINGAQIMSVDGNPQTDDAVLNLSYGLNPIRVEYYTNTTNGRLLLEWSSNGSAIGPTAQVIEPWFFYHGDENVAPHAQTEIETLFNPPSGTRVDQAAPPIEVFVMGPNGDVSLDLGGEEKILVDGYLSENFALQPGLNRIPYTVSDSDGRVREGVYNLYYDAETLTTPGLAASFYATEWYDWPLPKVDGLTAFARSTSPGIQLSEFNNITGVGHVGLHGGTIVRLAGTMFIGNAGEYEFRIADGGALFINGEQIAAIGFDYENQWNDDGVVNLPAGRHHVELWTGDPWDGPEMNVYWRLDGGPETLLPDSWFRYGQQHFRPVKQFVSGASTGRISLNQMCELMFQPGARFEDSSGNGLHFMPDPRAIERAAGGVTYQSPGYLRNEQAGVFMVAKIAAEERFSLEVDFVYEMEPNDWATRELISLTEGSWGSLARVYAQNDHVEFELYDNDGNRNTIEADNVLAEGQRYHVVATYDGTVMRLYANGAEVAALTVNARIHKWPNLASFNVGQYYIRRSDPSSNDDQVFATYLGAAAYSQNLSAAQVQINRQANLNINPTPGPLPAPPVTPYPLAGTTAADLDLAHHVLNRLSFGPSPDSVNQFLAMGIDPWIDQQLAPELIDDGEMENLLSFRPFHSANIIDDFRAELIFRMAMSQRQLLEVMTQFWENHFNTQIDKTQELAEEIAENQRFRTHAFGNFLDLLKSSAMHYPMTVYLDNDSNVVGAPNENYAREILELHCLGVNNGYTHDDIVEASRCFTGWTVQNGEFYFNPGLHDYGEKQLLGITIPAGGGMSDGIMLMEHLLTMPQTADFIAWKLCQVFIDDDPPADVVAAASGAFQASGGDIEQTLRAIFNHARFRTDLTYRGNKVKTPLEFLVSMARLAETPPLMTSVNYYLERMGMQLLSFPDPTGFAEEGVAWIDSNSLLERWNVINDVAANRGHGGTLGMNFKRYVEKRGATSSNELLDLFDSLTVHGSTAVGVRAVIEDWMTNGDPGSFVLDDDSLDNRVRQAFMLYLRLPEMNKQ